ncbi:hypothetical protein ACHAPT_008370 [Fusarium lateritium]
MNAFLLDVLASVFQESDEGLIRCALGDLMTLDGKERRSQNKKQQIKNDRLRSFPAQQLHDEVTGEERWLEHIGKGGGRHERAQLAHENVKKRWEEQGIWNVSLLTGALSSESERKAWRPSNRFRDQMSVERQRLLQLHENPPRGPGLKRASRLEDLEKAVNAHREALGGSLREELSRIPRLLDTTAYILVKAGWERRGIWDDAWGKDMPGELWKHERSLEDLIREAGLEGVEDSDTESQKGADSTTSTFGSVSYDDTDPGSRI